MSEFKTENSPFLTPTYQNVLMRALIDVILARNSGNITNYWQSLISLYFILSPKILKKISSEIDPILNNVGKIKAHGYNYTQQREYLQAATHSFKQQHADKIFTTIMNGLHEAGYGESDLTVKPRYGGGGTL